MKGLLFKPEMVRAILAGTKSQTRRIMKPQPMMFAIGKDDVWLWDKKQYELSRGWGQGMWPIFAPYRPGEIMYVKEGWGISGNGFCYRADTKQPETVHYAWRNAMFMPESASRIKLRIIEVTAQRLQEITKADVEAEGIKVTIGTGYTRIASQAYSELWDSINCAHPWDSNPWVWAYTFEKI